MVSIIISCSYKGMFSVMNFKKMSSQSPFFRVFSSERNLRYHLDQQRLLLAWLGRDAQVVRGTNHPLIKCLLSTYSVPGIFPGIKNRTMNKSDKKKSVLAFLDLYFQWGQQTLGKTNSYVKSICKSIC